MNYTTIEQSKKLLELGLDANTADFHCIDDHYNIPEVIAGFCNGWYEDYKESDRDYIPIWSVGALLEIIHNIEINDGFFDMMLWKSYDGWVLECANAGGNKCNKSLIDTCYDMVVWLLENNYIKKEGNT